MFKYCLILAGTWNGCKNLWFLMCYGFVVKNASLWKILCTAWHFFLFFMCMIRGHNTTYSTSYTTSTYFYVFVNTKFDQQDHKLNKLCSAGKHIIFTPTVHAFYEHTSLLNLTISLCRFQKTVDITKLCCMTRRENTGLNQGWCMKTPGLHFTPALETDW